jgi:hypothetical protein
MNELPADLRGRHADCLARAVSDLEFADADEIDQALLLLSGQQLREETGVSVAALMTAYHNFLKLPRDLLMLAVETCIQKSPFRPMVSDLRSVVQHELDARQRRLLRLQTSQP